MLDITQGAHTLCTYYEFHIGTFDCKITDNCVGVSALKSGAPLDMETDCPSKKNARLEQIYTISM
jgi:hypothetical protein